MNCNWRRHRRRPRHIGHRSDDTRPGTSRFFRPDSQSPGLPARAAIRPRPIRASGRDFRPGCSCSKSLCPCPARGSSESRLPPGSQPSRPRSRGWPAALRPQSSSNSAPGRRASIQLCLSAIGSKRPTHLRRAAPASLNGCQRPRSPTSPRRSAGARVFGAAARSSPATDSLLRATLHCDVVPKTAENSRRASTRTQGWPTFHPSLGRVTTPGLVAVGSNEI